MNRVMILLVVGLIAFSSAMKELNQLQQFTRDASMLVAEWSARMAPAEIPQTTPVTPVVAKLESCEIKQSLPSLELPWLAHVREKTAPRPSAVVPRPSQAIDFKNDLPEPGEIQIAKLNKFKKSPLIDIDPVRFEVRIPVADRDDDQDNVIVSDSSMTFHRARTRKQREFRISTRDREMLLKTLNRTINLRTAS